MARYSYGPTIQARVKRLFATLLAHAEDTAYEGDSNLSIRRLDDTPHCLIVKTKRRFLETLPKTYDGQAILKPAEVRDALSHYLAEHLGILVDNRTETQGSEEWHFTLTLWSTDTPTNLQRFDEEWNAKRSDKSKQYLTDQTQALSPDPANTIASPSARIFIVYKRTEPDASLAMQLHDALDQQHQVFIDRDLRIGTEWAKKLDAEICQSDFVITLLSEQAVDSEMFQREICIAHQTTQLPPGKPKLLPIRVAYNHPFPYPLSTYLNHIQWASWQGAQDTPRLLEELEAAIAGGLLPMETQPSTLDISNSAAFSSPVPVAQPILDLPDGTMESSSPFYIERNSDRMALETIQQQGKTISIKGPRQVGKSSLLNRVSQTALSSGKQVVFLDFQEFETATLQDADAFYKHFCLNLTYELDLEDETEKYWKIPLANKQRCTRYISKHLLKQLGQPLVLAMDEVERIFDTPFRDDFFSMLRSWHNQRARSPIWKQLDLVVVTSTEPYELIADLNQSPFNVGTVLALKDFTSAQVHQLNQQYGIPLTPPEQQQLMDLVHGHPFLVQRALYWVASNKMTAAELFDQAVSDNEPFGSHLKHHLFRIHDQVEQVAGLLEVFEKNECSDRGVYHLLQGAGLVREERTNVVVPRCQLYKTYLEGRLRN
ncbi:MAG: AAA-like domain-containing protein [Cyanobacteria bacterium P01_F01_bin.86]